MNSRRFKIELVIVGVLAAVLILLLPAMNAAGIVSDFSINVWGKYLCYAILALSVDLLWGYTGLLSLGQALFFALGGYMMGMHLMHKIGSMGQSRKPIPDFLVMLGWESYPSFWKPFDHFGFAMMMVILLPAVVAAAFGYLAFRSRIKGVYFSILTQALTYAATLMFFSNTLLMGGNNGFTDFKLLLGADVRTPETQRKLFICTAVLLVGVYLLCRWLTRTKFGLVQRAVRDSEVRVLFSGYAAAGYKLFVFVVCAIIAGMAGALYVPQVGIINPGEMETTKSLEIVVWVALGGRGTLVGPIVGAVCVNALKSWATVGRTADYWLIILGGLFILVVLFMPKGIVGIPAQIRSYFKRSKTGDKPPIAGAKPATP